MYFRSVQFSHFVLLYTPLGCVHIDMSMSPALSGYLHMSSGKHKFACTSMAAVHIHTSMGYL